jgi:SAM-dependent methyltransferase
MAKTRLERWARALTHSESRKIVRILEPVERSARVVEIGCGHGRKLAMLRDLGFTDLTGVEKNPDVAASTAARGFRVLSPEEFAAQDASCDLLVMAHIIEHFPTEGLLAMLDAHLDRLRTGGRLLVVTPTLHPHFWLDFDHVKPYYPQGFTDFFGAGGEQVSTPSSHVLKLKDVHFRRSPFRIKNSRALLLKTPGAVWPRLANLGFALAHRASFGLVGRNTGWIGLFVKKQQ